MTTGRDIVREKAAGGRGAIVVLQQQERTVSSSIMKAGGGRMKEAPGGIPSHALRSSAPKKPSRSPQEEMLNQTDAGESSPTSHELLITVKRLEKGFLSLADAVIAEIEGMREDARCWQDEREELWKTVMAFHGRDMSEMEPITRRLDSLEKRACDIEKHLQSRDPDTRAPAANDRLDELERRAYDLENQVKKKHHLLQAPTQAVQTVLEKPAAFKDSELASHRSSLLELQRGLKLEGCKRLTMLSRSPDPEEAIHAVRKDIEELRTTSRNGELQQTELQYNVSAITHDLHKLQVWCKLFENDQAMRLQRLTESITDSDH